LILPTREQTKTETKTKRKYRRKATAKKLKDAKNTIKQPPQIIYQQTHGPVSF
jgi:hypothetical protein